MDTLKVDKSFIDSILNDESTRIITQTVIEMARKLGYETVAEGVETEEQMDLLKSLGCDIIQGYYLSKPVPDTEIEEILLRV